MTKKVVAFFIRTHTIMKLGLNTISVWFGLIMILLLLTGSGVFIFTNFMSDTLYGGKRVFFVALLLSYSVYRGIRIYQVLKRSANEE